jgi:peptide subunit release factor 1 (eRF1)
VIDLAVPMRNQIVVNHTPHVRQLEAVIHNHERFGVLVADRQRARMFVFEQGLLIDRNEQFEHLPRHDDDGGEWDRDHVRDHSAAMAHAHLRRAAAVAFAVHRERPLDHLILAVPPEFGPEVERELHTYLRDRIAARIVLPARSSVARIRQAVMEVDGRFQRTREAGVVDRMRDRLGSGNGAAAGLDAVLGALSQRRVETLLVSEGFVAPGWRCWACDHVDARGRTCPTCGGEMTLVDDVVEEAVEVALSQACRVVTCQENADLDVHGRIGALLRF